MKMSRTGWNNVIIFSVMAYILLINTTHKTLFGGDNSASLTIPILPEHTIILSMAINNQLTIERIGQTWRSRPSVSMSGQAFSAMMMAWQQSEGSTLPEPPVLNDLGAIIVVITLAGEEKPYVVELYPLKDELLLHLVSKQQWLSVAPEIYQQLLPHELNPQ